MDFAAHAPLSKHEGQSINLIFPPTPHLTYFAANETAFASMANEGIGDLVLRLLAAASSLPTAQATEIREIATKLSVATTGERRVAAEAANSASTEVNWLKHDLQRERSQHGSVRADLTRAKAAANNAASIASVEINKLKSELQKEKSQHGIVRSELSRAKAATNNVVAASASAAPVQPKQLMPPSQTSAPETARKRPYSEEMTVGPVKKRARPEVFYRQPVCKGCLAMGPSGCNHQSQCSRCKTWNMRCIYQACGNIFCPDTTCTRLHPGQWSYDDRPRWNLEATTQPQSTPRASDSLSGGGSASLFSSLSRGTSDSLSHGGSVSFGSFGTVSRGGSAARGTPHGGSVSFGSSGTIPRGGSVSFGSFGSLGSAPRGGSDTLASPCGGSGSLPRDTVRPGTVICHDQR